jgi:hypothetical protein
MIRRTLTLALAVSMLGGLTFTSRSVAEEGITVKEPLDRATIYQPTISKSQPIRVGQFSTDNAELGTGANKNKPKYRKIAEEMKTDAPKLLAEGMVDELKTLGFANVAEITPNERVGSDWLIVEGEFTVLNPGSKGKRYLVGFGAGSSKTCTAGRVISTDGTVLADFDHCRSQAFGILGGDSEAQMMKDSMKSGTRFAEFMSRWATGDYAR